MKTIKDIAKIAGVSQSTVSKALNNRPDVSDATKSRILDIAREFDFTPNAFGKGLKMRMSENLGLIFCRDIHPISGNPFYSRVLEGVEGEVAINNFNLILHIITDACKDSLPKMMRERQVDGVILVGSFEEQYISKVLQKDIPVVFIDPKEPLENRFQILIDNEHGAFIATKHLIDCGHRKIGFVSGDLTRMSFKQRFDGYMKALNLHNIPICQEFIKTGGLENGYVHVKGMLSAEKPTAIFAANDINAIYGYRAINELGLKIPDDISIVGFDDIEMAKISTPPLTTVRVYKEELGSIAVRTLLKLINNKNEKPITTVVPIRLIERDSVKYI